MVMNNIEEEPWHLDKRVPVALIFTLMVQTSGIVWWASSISERVLRLEHESARSLTADGRLIRLETQMSAVADALLEAKATLRRIEDGLMKDRN
jgi:hypothetical protein